MSTARPAAESADGETVAAGLRDARFVRVFARADGDSLAASGVLARACRTLDVPFQVRTRPTAATTDEAGTTGDDGSDALRDDAVEAGAVDQRPGVAVPVDDLGDGLAHSTLAHGPYSGEVERLRADFADLDLPADLDDDAHRRLASLVAVQTATADDATPRAAEAVERLLRPYATPDAPFATLGGFADVLDAVARERPGTGVALALGHDARDAALAAWREHALVVHRALREATTGRYDGLFVARVDTAAHATLGTVARLCRDFRSPEPTVLVVADEHAAAASVDAVGVGRALSTAVSAFDGTAGGTTRTGDARFEAPTKEFIAAFREAL
jgi:ABC-type transporter Mla MlaB component